MTLSMQKFQPGPQPSLFLGGHQRQARFKVQIVFRTRILSFVQQLNLNPYAGNIPVCNDQVSSLPANQSAALAEPPVAFAFS